MNGKTGKWSNRDGQRGEVAQEEQKQNAKDKYDRAVLVFDMLSLQMYHGLDFRLKLVEDPETLDIAEKLIVKLNKK